MTFKVKIMESAEADFVTIFEFISDNSRQGAEAWATAFQTAIDSLKEYPHNCSLAPENDAYPYKLRQFFFRTRKGRTYRGIITIDDELVYVLHVRGASQDVMQAENIQPPEA